MASKETFLGDVTNEKVGLLRKYGLGLVVAGILFNKVPVVGISAITGGLGMILWSYR